MEYLPGLQALQVVAPAAEEYFPGPQAVHVLTAIAPLTEEYVPAEQATQRLDSFPLPAATLYLPAGHAMHSDPSAPFAEKYPAAHCVHAVAAVVCPAAVPVYPVAQAVHPVVPSLVAP